MYIWQRVCLVWATMAAVAKSEAFTLYYVVMCGFMRLLGIKPQTSSRHSFFQLHTLTHPGTSSKSISSSYVLLWIASHTFGQPAAAGLPFCLAPMMANLLDDRAM